MKKILERIEYRFFKKHLLRVAKKIGNPLVGLHFLTFVELELDKVFSEEGFAAVKKAAEEWPEKFQKEMDEKFQHLEKDLKTAFGEDEETKEMVKEFWGEREWREIKNRKKRIVNIVPDEQKL